MEGKSVFPFLQRPQKGRGRRKVLALQNAAARGGDVLGGWERTAQRFGGAAQPPPGVCAGLSPAFKGKLVVSLPWGCQGDGGKSSGASGAL